MRTESMDVSLRLFAQCRSQAGGRSRIPLTLKPGARVSDLWAVIDRTHPALSTFRKSARIAINYEFVDLETPIRATDEVALIPPVCGG